MNNTKHTTERRRKYLRKAWRFWPEADYIKIGHDGIDPYKACWAVREGCPPLTVRIYEDRSEAERRCGGVYPHACCGEMSCNPDRHWLYDLRPNPPERVELTPAVEGEDANATA